MRWRRRGVGQPALVAVLLLLLAGLTGWGAPRAAAETRLVETAVTIPGTPEADGRAVDLDATLLTGAPQTPQPTIVLAHGFGGTKTDSLPTARTLARAGYTVIIYTARGFGRSGGLIHLDDPAYEGADAVRVVDFAAGRPEVAQAGGDPVIGFAGASYGGAVSLLAAALDPRVDAIAPAFTWSNLAQSLFPQNATDAPASSLAGLIPSATAPAAGSGVFKQRWASLLFGNAGQQPSGTGQAALCGRFDPALCRGYLAAAESGRADGKLLALLRRSSPDRLLSSVSAPTLLVQGEDDTLFPLDQADANLRGLPASTPAKLVWVTGGHDAGINTDDLVPLLEGWFGRYLKHDGSAPDTAFSVALPKTSLVGQGGAQDPDTLVTPAYPGRGAPLGERPVALTGAVQTVVSPPGGSPASLTNLPGTGGALGSAAAAAGYPLAVLPGQSATFTSAPLTAPLDLVGSSRVTLDVTSDTGAATLFAAVWDLGPDLEPSSASPSRTAPRPSTAVLPQLAVAPVRLAGLTPGRASSVQVALPAVAHQVPVGHRVQLVVSSTDQAYATPVRAAVYRVGLAGGGLTVPQLGPTTGSGRGLDVPLPLVLVVAGLALAAAVTALLVWLRRRDVHARADLLGVPLVVQDVAKTYGDGFRAVDGVSFSAEAGQVVGLLGPNGAGKTTVMRMLVGLIRPDSGAVFVQGRPVHAGADVLDAVGAFIEGPGFLPHLTGRQNLLAFWQATGRPLEEAHLDEALRIAGLGTALDRKVRGYSQGMRQRLGIAQAMLGLPSLLLLDEPTNGLDPPQIKAMRAVLADYAAAGRTVLVSSHLLSEVEHTCSHVVVMHRGRVVLTGSVAELTATDRVTLIGLSDPDQAPAASAALTGRGLEVAHESSRLRVSGELPRDQVVAALVNDGYRIDSVDGHRQLEEVFLNLVGPPPGASGADDE